MLVRRASGSAVTGSTGGNRVVEHVIDYDWPDADSDIFDVDSVICALGTTIRTAGSQAAFRKVDYEYPLRIAGIARRHGASHFAIVSAIGADPQARTFYSRVKGNVEQSLRKLDYPVLTIVRPSFLMGERNESRPLESIARRLGVYLPPKWRSISVERVARALVTEVLSGDTRGINIIENDALRLCAAELSSSARAAGALAFTLPDLLFEREVQLARLARFRRPEAVDEFDEIVERQRIGNLLVRAARFVDQIEQAAGQANRRELRIAAAGF
jgi:uncharacterized protein YbjT (DUF2867 family)